MTKQHGIRTPNEFGEFIINITYDKETEKAIFGEVAICEVYRNGIIAQMRRGEVWIPKSKMEDGDWIVTNKIDDLERLWKNEKI